MPTELSTSHRILSSVIGSEPSTQRENLFYTKCAIGTKVCSLIIDGGCCTNVASRYMVEKLGLTTTDHPRPYQLRWLNGKEIIRVKEQVQISFRIGNYEDTIICDVIPMQAGHMLLGQPWQSDRKAIQDGNTNQYVITHGGRKFRLVPLSPEQIRELPKVPLRANSSTNLLMTSRQIEVSPCAVPLRLTNSKLAPQGDGPFPVVQKINENAYQVELPGDYQISSTFNVADLSPFELGEGEGEEPGSEPFQGGRNDEVISTPPKLEDHPVRIEAPMTRSRTRELRKMEQRVRDELNNPSKNKSFLFNPRSMFITVFDRGKELSMNEQ